MLSVFSSPRRYTQGRNATAWIAQEMKTLGLDAPALIVAGSSATRLLSSVWERSFSEAGFEYSVLAFGGECSFAEIERVSESARRSRARVIVGAGGGKVLDTARAAASGLGLPVVSCPTVASSDAPCSALSVVYTEEGAFQEYRIYGKNPDLVLVDTDVIAHSPPACWLRGWATRLPPGLRPRPAPMAACATCAAALPPRAR